MDTTNSTSDQSRERLDEATIVNSTPSMSAEQPHENGSQPGDDNSQVVSVVSASQARQGSISSGRFNILSTMVGGGSLSLPLAFQKSGNAALAPLLLLVAAGITEFCFRAIIASARALSPPDASRRGQDSYESIASAAFGPKAYVMGTFLVTALCFFGTVAYAVLLRDMLQPISAHVFGDSTSGPTLANNATMLIVVLGVTPLCTLKTLTALERFGALSMFSVLILGSCIVYRSIECNVQHSHDWHEVFQFGPVAWKDVLDVFPIYVSCFVCHYNIPVVHNEIQNPTPKRVNWWLRSTTWIAATFYMIMGVAGSAYAPCSPSTSLQGNILLDFDNDDPLLFVGRMCLALTITLAFPMLTIPARDIILRSLCKSRSATAPSPVEEENNLEEPLLEQEEADSGLNDGVDDSTPSHSFSMLLIASILVFWTAASLASCVESIDIVWDLLGSSLSIFMSYLVPCGSFLVITRFRQAFNADRRPSSLSDRLSAFVAWTLITICIPLMFLSTGNAVLDTFFNTSAGDDSPVPTNATNVTIGDQFIWG